MGGMPWCALWDLILSSRGFIGTKWIIQDGNYKGKSKVSRHEDKKRIKNPRVEKDKIVLVVNQAWNASFALLESTRKQLQHKDGTHLPLIYLTILRFMEQ